MKKVVKITSVIISAVLIAALLSSCITIEPITQAHEHSFKTRTEYTSALSTCTEPIYGYRITECTICNTEFGREYTVISPPLGHNFFDGICTRCGEISDYTSEFELQMNNDGFGYTLVGIGSCTNEYIYINQANGLPITAIADNAFSGCENLIEVTIGSNVKMIGNSAFLGCNNLVTVNFDGSLYSIGHSAFMGCTSLFSVNFNGEVYEIGREAFSHCTSLSAIALPHGISSINAHMFLGCSNLYEVVIPSTVNSLGGGIFNDCTSLSAITISGATPEWLDVVFGRSEIPENVTLSFSY